jgi:hypothetical protein
MPRIIQYKEGDKIGNFFFVKEGERRREKNGQIGRMAYLKCMCGRITLLSLNRAKDGRQKACGCLATIDGNPEKHLLSKTSEYKIWAGAKARCYNPKNPHYNNYGGRGIKMCDRWKNSFKNFISDMGKRTTPTHTLERNDNDGNYEPENCIWATRAEQSSNRRMNVRITYLGETKTISEWARKNGFRKSAIGTRIKNGWSSVEAIATPNTKGKSLRQVLSERLKVINNVYKHHIKEYYYAGDI